MVPVGQARYVMSRKGQATMQTKKCPLCQGENLFLVSGASLASIALGTFKYLAVHPLICLECGFVAPALDHDELVSVREYASRERAKSPRE